MDAKHQFKYTYNETDLEEHCPVAVTFEMPGDATLDQMLYNFQCYLKASGFIFDGELEIVDHSCDECCDQIECDEDEDTTIGEYSKEFWQNVGWDQHEDE